MREGRCFLGKGGRRKKKNWDQVYGSLADCCSLTAARCSLLAVEVRAKRAGWKASNGLLVDVQVVGGGRDTGLLVLGSREESLTEEMRTFMIRRAYYVHELRTLRDVSG